MFHITQFLTYIMSLIKHHYRFLSQLFGHQISYLGVQQVVVAVYHDVGMQDLSRNINYLSIKAALLNAPD